MYVLVDMIDSLKTQKCLDWKNVRMSSWNAMIWGLL